MDGIAGFVVGNFGGFGWAVHSNLQTVLVLGDPPARAQLLWLRILLLWLLRVWCEPRRCNTRDLDRGLSASLRFGWFLRPWLSLPPEKHGWTPTKKIRKL